MNKFAKAGIAGAAALAIAAGGGTYAIWTDFAINDDNAVGADSLKITIAGAPSGSNQLSFNKLDLSPGESYDQENVITGRVGGNDVNLARATVTYNITEDAENGCGGTNAEADAEDCTSGLGELSQFAQVTTINRTDASTAGTCSGPGSGLNLTSIVKPSDNLTLADLDGEPIVLGNMEDGTKWCVKMVIALPDGTGNVVMTDSTNFDLRYDLEQLPN
jgi:alternate signal-mediated exported protein